MDGRAQQPKRIKENENPFFIRRTSDAYLYDPENGTSKSGTRIITAGCLSPALLCAVRRADATSWEWVASCGRTARSR